MPWAILAPLNILENQKQIFRTTQDVKQKKKKTRINFQNQESHNQGF
jgi:hypothetical protein